MPEISDDLLKTIKQSVRLPKTRFAMKANLAQNETLSLKRWKKQDLYANVLNSQDNSPSFTFHDGPPYANGNIHVGHLLNKVLKDFVVRSQSLLGKQCPYTPGWDCHGLPIEHKVMQSLAESGALGRLKDLEPDVQKMAIRSECLTYAKTYIKRQSKQMQSLLTMADYDRPYLTMSKSFESKTLEVFATLVDETLVYRQLKPVHWSIANQTALADAELEYYDKTDTACYVGFSLDNIASVFPDISDPVSLLIWTTTPWTLPANLAVAVHKNHNYSLVQSEKGYFVMATDLCTSLSEKLGLTFMPISSIKGTDLLGLTYTHPFIDQTGSVIHGDFVNLEDGSGLVHIAPGHGTDDYLVGMEHGLEPYCPVLEDGCFDNSAPDWIQGLSIWDANPVIISQLSDSGHLIYHHDFQHSYPHDWRSKTPVIFRSTEQWFIGVDHPLKSSGKSLRELALSAIDSDIEFVPSWGQKRLRGMLESRPDWCISRQRSWGLPIPAFRSGSVILLTAASVRAIAQVFAEEGSDAWFKQDSTALLRHYDASSDPDFPVDFDLNTAEKMMDIFDVWFESGSSWHAVLQANGQGFPADLYLEGSDQHRGWFHLSLLASLGVHQKAPYKRLLTHGFIVDKDGHKMSKSSGNALDVQDLLAQYGAEVCRWWVSSLSYDADIKVDLSFFDVASESYRKIRNTLRFLLSNLTQYTPASSTSACIEKISAIPDTSIERYMLLLLSQLQRDVRQAYDALQFKQVHQLIYDFCNDHLSSFYCSMTKDCLYCDPEASDKRQRVQFTFQVILEVLCRLLNPLLPHTSEEAYQVLHNDDTLLLPLAEPFNVDLSGSIEHWAPLLDARKQGLKLLEDSKKKGIENSLDAGLTLPESLRSFSCEHFELADFFGVSRVQFGAQDSITVLDLRNEPRCARSWKRDASVKQREGGVFLSDRDAAVLQR